MNPTISVVMSVFNGEEYLAEAIDSVLSQTFKDFEFLIIDDGSSDKSHHIISKFAKNDHRIRVITHSHNRGLVYGLNEAVAAAAGKYIARMDADDVALPERLEIQLAYMEAHPQCAVLATRVTVIDELGIQQSDWEEDAENVGGEEIRRYMPVSNCIAHPSVLVRADIMKKYGYRSVPAAEDYDLWLRLLADGHKIAKLPEKLLLYRIHSQSITQTANRQSVARKLRRAKTAFLKWRLSHFKFNLFDLRVAINLAASYVPPIKNFVKKILFIPSFSLERLKVTWLQKSARQNRQKPRLLFILSWLTMGGVDKVMLNLVNGLSQDYEVHIITTEPSKNEWEHRFTNARSIHHLPPRLKFRTNFFRYIAWFIKRNKIACVIISNSLKGYESLPYVKRLAPDVKVIDILHGQGGTREPTSFPSFSVPFRPCINRCITVTRYLARYMETKFNVPRGKITVIHNGVDLNEFSDLRRGTFRQAHRIPDSAELVAWIGRFSLEKQPMLALETAKAVIDKKPSTVFVFAGSGEYQKEMEQYVNRHKISGNVILPGPVDDIAGLLADTDAVLMTSEMEGLPLALLEAAAAGVPAVASKVGGIPELVKDGRTGRLVELNKDAAANFADALLDLLGNDTKRQRFAKMAKEQAQKFSVDRMIKEYEQVLKDS